MAAEDPLAALRSAKLHGVAVQPLGTKILGGQRVWGYSVTPTKASLIATGLELWREMGLTPSEVAAAKATIEAGAQVTEREWFDSSGLVREIRAALELPGVSMQMQMHFVSYGAPVHIAAPPSWDVAPFSSYLSALRSSAF